MPRAKRQTFAEVTIDRATEQVLEAVTHLPAPTPEEVAAAERAADRYIRRFEKAQARWRAMSPDERREWVANYVAGRTGGSGSIKAPKVADLPMLFAIVAVGEKAASKARREYEAERTAQDAAERQRRAENAERRAAEPRLARATRPAPEADDAATDTTPRKARKRRRGPSIGIVALQMPDGSYRHPIYDED